MKLSVVIPFWNMWPLTHTRLMELYTHIPGDVEIILLDDCSTKEQEIKNGVAWWQTTERHKIRYFRNEENLGFGGSCNVGVKIAEKHGADVIALLSNDVKVKGNFVPLLLSKFEQDENILVGNRVIYWPAGWNVFRWKNQETVVPYAEGWFISTTVEGWNELGGFDPLYGRFDYEDLDLSTRAIELGYNVVELSSPYLSHDHQGSTIETLNVDRMAITQKNREKYIEKWKATMPTIHERLERKNARTGQIG